MLAAVLLALAAVLTVTAAPSSNVQQARPAAALPASSPVPLQGWSSLSDISSFSESACGVYALESNAALCWGRQLARQLPTPDSTQQLLLANFSAPTLVAVDTPRAWRQLASGAYLNGTTGVTDAFNCGIQADGSASCWGSDFSGIGLLGAGISRSSLIPLPLAEGGPWDGIAVGVGFSCALRSDDSSVYCWGSNRLGYLGCGLSPKELPWTARPCRVNSTQTWLSVAAGQTSACAINVTGGLWCWGALGRGTPDGSPLVFSSPQPVAGASGVVSVGMGAQETCLVFKDGAAACFAAGTWPARLEPVPGNSLWQAVAVGANHRCGITRRGGKVLCWGSNQSGQCGNGRSNSELTQPTPLAGPASGQMFSQVQTGDRFTCARTAIGEVYCWGARTSTNASSLGRTFGELGHGTFESSAVPVLVVPPKPSPPSPPRSPRPSPPPPFLGLPPPPPPPPPAPAPPIPVGTAGVLVGEIVGGVMGGVAAFVLASVAFVLVLRRRRNAPTGPELPTQDPNLDNLGSKVGSSSSKVVSSGGKPDVEERELMRRQKGGASSPAIGTAVTSSSPLTPQISDLTQTDELLSWISTHPRPPLDPSMLHVGTGGGDCGGANSRGANSGGVNSSGGANSGGTNSGGASSGAGDAMLSGSTPGGSSTGSAQRSVVPGSIPGVPGSTSGTSALGSHSGGSSSGKQLDVGAGSGPLGRLVDLRSCVVSFAELRMERLIGQGSFGKVYFAHMKETPVAVKILMKLEAAGEEGSLEPVTLSSPALAGLYREAELMAAIRHPNIVALMGVCTYPPALVTEYCARGNLTDVLAEGRRDPAYASQLTWALRLHFALDAAKGMLALHAHSPPIVHRDLKSPNLLVDYSWRVKVSDFNLSKILEQEPSLASTQAPVNPRWLAPEILQGSRASLASDVFSFGMCLYELLTWQVPWGPADFWEIVRSLLAGERLPIPPLDQLPGPDTAAFAGLAAYCGLMQRCWAQDPKERPLFADIIPELRRLLEQAP